MRLPQASTISLIARPTGAPFVNTLAHAARVSSPPPRPATAAAKAEELLSETVALRAVWQHASPGFDAMTDDQFLLAAAEVDQLARLTAAVYGERAHQEPAGVYLTRGLPNKRAGEGRALNAYSGPALGIGMQRGGSKHARISAQVLAHAAGGASAVDAPVLKAHGPRKRLMNYSPLNMKA